MTLFPFKQIHKATALGFFRFSRCLPILLRTALILLFVWYYIELILSCNPRWFITAFAFGFGAVFLAITSVTLIKYPWRKDDAIPLEATSITPFLAINLFMILLVCAIGKWEQHRGSPGFTRGLLAFTELWAHKIGDFVRDKFA